MKHTENCYVYGASTLIINNQNSKNKTKKPTKNNNCCGSLLAEIQDSEANSRKQCFIVPAQTQRTHVQRLSPENKGVSPYISLQAGYRSKKQGVLWGYFICSPKVLYDFALPGAT
jgi:hypothetical protein